MHQTAARLPIVNANKQEIVVVEFKVDFVIKGLQGKITKLFLLDLSNVAGWQKQLRA